MEIKRVKKVLIITYYWPPSGGAGVQRWLKFTKYLRDFGWEPVIYTPENPEYPELDSSLAKDIPENIIVLKQPIWEPYHAYKQLIGRKNKEQINAAFLTEKKQNKFLEKLTVWIRGNFFIPDARKFWIKPSVRFLKEYIRLKPVDVLVSTGPPHSMHLIAKQIHESSGIPWLADFRDPWTNIDFYTDLLLTPLADKKHHRLEKEVLQKATTITVISKSMAKDFQKILNREYAMIPNGFDADDIGTNQSVTLDKKFSIAHIGTLTRSRNPIIFWEAVKELTAVHPDLCADLEIKLVGKVDFSVTQTIEESGLTSFVNKMDYLPHAKVVRLQQQSQVLLLIINNTPNAQLIVTGKFFEYLAAKRPILCIGPPDGDAAAILRETNSGLISPFTDKEGMKKNILHLYTRYKTSNLFCESKEIMQFSRKELTRKLVNSLNEMTN